MFPNNLLLQLFVSNSRWKNTPFTYHKNCSTQFPPYFRIIFIHPHPHPQAPPPGPPLRAYSPGPDGQLARQVPWYTVPSGHVLEPKPLFWPCRKPPAKPCHTAWHGGGTALHVAWEVVGSGGNLRLLKVRNEMSWTSTGETQNWFSTMWEWPLS